MTECIFAAEERTELLLSEMSINDAYINVERKK